VTDKLALDAGQKAKLEALADQMLAQRRALLGTAGQPGTGTGTDTSTEPRAQLKALIAAEKFDRSQARSLLEQKAGAVQAQGPKVIDAMADFYDSLNAQQQAQVRELLDKRGRGGWWQRG
jgi:Spy/CpxP family protein refolding chaperone